MSNKNLTEAANRLTHIFALMNNTQKCLVKKCKKEQNESIKANKQLTAKVLELSAKLNKKKIDYKTYMKELQEIRLKINNSAEKMKLIHCQLENCYDETRKMTLYSVQLLIEKNTQSKNTKKVEELKKLEKQFKKKLTPDEIRKLDNMAIKGQF